MYLPKHFDNKDEQRILEVIDAHPFATVMSFDEKNQPFFSHVPLLVKKMESGFSLIGHVSRRNPQWSHFKNKPMTKVIVHGSHTYITLKWYRSGRDVPTWNYVSIHMDGPVRVIEDFDGLIGILKGLTKKFEEGSLSPWEFELPDDLLTPETLCSAIVGFEVAVEMVDAKFKLSQNRSQDDRDGVLRGLETRSDEMSRRVRELMEANQ